MFKHEFNKRETSMMAILAILVVIYVYFLIIHRPVTQQMEALNAQIESTQTQITELQSRQIKLKEMKEELASTTAVEIPSFDNLQDLIIFLHAIMPDSSEYDIRYNDPEPVVENSSILARKLSVSFTANSYETARHMLLQLEESPYRCQIDHVQISSLQDKVPITASALSVDLQVSFFEYKANTQPAAEAQG